jgi:hypothetical protein
VIGRIYFGVGARCDKWLCAVNGFGSRQADTREEAMAALKTQYLRGRVP